MRRLRGPSRRARSRASGCGASGCLRAHRTARPDHERGSSDPMCRPPLDAGHRRTGCLDGQSVRSQPLPQDGVERSAVRSSAPIVPSINQRIKTTERAGRGDKSTHVRSTRIAERRFTAALPVALCSLRLCYERFDQVLPGRFRERTRRTKSATAWPISWGLSSWRKWPLTVSPSLDWARAAGPRSHGHE